LVTPLPISSPDPPSPLALKIVTLRNAASMNKSSVAFLKGEFADACSGSLKELVTTAGLLIVSQNADR